MRACPACPGCASGPRSGGAPAPLACFTCPPELGRHASPGRGQGAQAGGCRGTPTGSASPPESPSNRRESRGASSWQHPSDRPLATPCSTRPSTNPDTTPIRSRACRTAPKRSVFSRPQDASCCPSSRHTTHIRPTSTHHPQSSTLSCSQPGRRIPTAPRSATGTLATGFGASAARRPTRGDSSMAARVKSVVLMVVLPFSQWGIWSFLSGSFRMISCYCAGSAAFQPPLIKALNSATTSLNFGSFAKFRSSLGSVSWS